MVNNRVDGFKTLEWVFIFFVRVAPRNRGGWFWFYKKPEPTAFEKGPFLWANKENEQDTTRTRLGLKYTYRNNTLLEDVYDAISKFEKRLGRY